MSPGECKGLKSRDAGSELTKGGVFSRSVVGLCVEHSPGGSYSWWRFYMVLLGSQASSCRGNQK